ncbi:Uncharacterised protein [Corynebacterium imitans]|uniref:Sensory transduction regulator n=1 Tax=Corynebacterium imitans TaxID=156978 RepID=A0A076NNQ2_9CORY|nr:YbjN domain-containing protein [Corynebacterium imitans]AIJ33415.1 hypothetical protein CIMIT_05430 [Corynebacterium imitans]SNV69372.1 Uncharacterised protein [Corynebacterium imitans]
MKQTNLDRVRDYFQAQEWTYTDAEDPDTIKTVFAGIAMDISYTSNTIVLFTTIGVAEIKASRFGDVLEFCEQFNNARSFPTAIAIEEPERDLAALGISYALPCQWQHTDEQFRDFLDRGILGVVNTAKAFLSEFAPEVLRQLPE